MKKILTAVLLSLASNCSMAQAETIWLRFTVPTTGGDPTTCIATSDAVAVRKLSLHTTVSGVPAQGDPVIVSKTGLFTPGSADSLQASRTAPGTLKYYVRAENNAGAGCASNVVTVVFDGVPPAKITNLGE